MKTATLLGTLFTALAMSIPAQAAIIDMEALGVGYCDDHESEVSTDGYTFRGTRLFACAPGVLSQGPSRGLIDGDGEFRSALSMQADDLGVFRLSSFSAGSRTLDFDTTGAHPDFGATGMTVVGILAAGGTVSTTFQFDGLLWGTFVLPSSFTGLSQVSFTALGDTATPQFMIDDINVSAVPEPQTAAMLLAGLGLVAFAARRRRRT